LHAGTMRAIDDARRLDLDLLASRMTDQGSLRAHARRYRELKGRDPTWEISLAPK
jgi:enoyl-CoA hydratase